MVSVPPQAYVVERIADTLATVKSLLPPGAGHAGYEPDMSQLKDVSHASLFIKVGHPHFTMERAWLDRVLSERPGLKVISAYSPTPAHEVNEGALDEGSDDHSAEESSSAHEHAAGDPHIWVAPAYVRKTAAKVHAVLIEQMPGHRRELDANYRKLVATIDSVDSILDSLLEPFSGREFYVYHSAWHHFAGQYGLKQVAMEQGHREPSPAELKELIAQAREDSVKAVFVQPQVNRSNAVLLAEAVGAEIIEVDPLGRDWPGSLLQMGHSLAKVFGK